MNLFYQEPISTIYCGHALDLKELPPESVDMCMTSPPYWGLRSYKTEPQIWDSKDGCRHEWNEYNKRWHSGTNAGAIQLGDKGAFHNDFNNLSNFCSLCGAWRGELGLEPTIELYIKHLIQIFNEVKQVLKKTGTCWVNIDDSYASGKGTCFNPGGGKGSFSSHGDRKDSGVYPLDRGNIAMLKAEGLLSKSLCLIPARFALAMLEDGWILRNDIVWNKPNPMPESVKDRFTGSWEHLFFFVKSNTIQYWTNPVTSGITDKQPLGTKGKWGIDWIYRKTSKKERNRVSLWQGHTYFFEQQFEKADYDGRHDTIMKPSGKYADRNHMIDGANANSVHTRGAERWPTIIDGIRGRNKRDVWETTTQPYPEAHFATFPEKLCETPILAGCPSMICKKCGKVREKIYETERTYQSGSGKSGNKPFGSHFDDPQCVGDLEDDVRAGPCVSRQEIGYTDCGCNAGFEAGVVLDPFCGSGTALAVAKKRGRKSIGIDISSDYCKLTVKRIQEIPIPMELV